MRLLCAATPLLGHLNPILSLAAIMIGRGDEVVVATASHFAARVRAVGATFEPLHRDIDVDFSRAEDLVPERARISPGLDQFRFDLERGFVDTLPAQAATLRTLMARYAPDLVVSDTGFCGRLAIVLDRTRPRPPVVTLNITFLPLPRPDGAPLWLGLPPAATDGERRQYAMLARHVEEVFDAPVQARLAGTFARMGLRAPVPSPTEMLVGATDAFLQPSVPAFEYDLGPLPPHIHFVGGLPAPAGTAPASPEWWDRLDGSRPIVLVTQGTAANFDFDELIHPTLRALARRDDLHVVVTTGGRPVEGIRAPPRPNLFVAPFVDYRALIPRLAVLVTNGGYGTVSLALRAGIPVVAAGRSEDKAEIGARVAWSGVGVEIATSRPEPGQIGAAVDRVLADPSFRARAQAMRRAFDAIDTRREVFRILDGLVAGRPSR